MKMLTLALALLLSAPVVSGAQSELRYVVPGPTNGGQGLWTDWLAYNTCARASLYGKPADRKAFCEDGVTGVKPQVTLEPGTTVERLDSTDCRTMVRIRVGTGAFKGQAGCIAGDALTSIKPE